MRILSQKALCKPSLPPASWGPEKETGVGSSDTRKTKCINKAKLKNFGLGGDNKKVSRKK